METLYLITINIPQMQHPFLEHFSFKTVVTSKENISEKWVLDNGQLDKKKGNNKISEKKFLNRKKRKISKMKISGRSCVRSRPSKAVGAQFCRNLPPTLSHTLSHTFSATFSHTCHISIYFCLGSKMFLWWGRPSTRFLWNWGNIRSWVNPAVPWENIDPYHDHCMNILNWNKQMMHWICHL